ncbi:hypothetical protein ACQP2E_11795 [Actinoplanes sp. CA-015351]|uniref:hypothetical protein n=1 Tax=Actinoplanes sp. CA-015351 TaxID=3239897 RepID=UPI003D996161
MPSALDSALQAAGARIIKISGTIALTGMHRVASNKTIQGAGSSSGLSGGGLTLDLGLAAHPACAALEKPGRVSSR